MVFDGYDPSMVLSVDSTHVPVVFYNAVVPWHDYLAIESAVSESQALSLQAVRHSKASRAASRSGKIHILRPDLKIFDLLGQSDISSIYSRHVAGGSSTASSKCSRW